MGLLDGGLQQMFGAAFSGVLLEGRHYQRAETRDAKGNVTATVTRTQSVRAYRQTMTRALREAGFADSIAVLLILQTYEGRVIERPKRGSQVRLEGALWVVGNTDTDAANVAWVVGVSPADG